MSEGILHITDSRTFLEYEIPIHRNTIKAGDFKALKAPSAGTDPADQVSEGIRLFDPGFKNTAASQSEITFMYESWDQRRSLHLSILTCFWTTEMAPKVLCNTEDTVLRNFGRRPSLKIWRICSSGITGRQQWRKKPSGKTSYQQPRRSPPVSRKSFSHSRKHPKDELYLYTILI